MCTKTPSSVFRIICIYTTLFRSDYRCTTPASSVFRVGWITRLDYNSDYRCTTPASSACRVGWITRCRDNFIFWNRWRKENISSVFRVGWITRLGYNFDYRCTTSASSVSRVGWITRFAYKSDYNLNNCDKNPPISDIRLCCIPSLDYNSDYRCTTPASSACRVGWITRCRHDFIFWNRWSKENISSVFRVGWITRCRHDFIFW